MDRRHAITWSYSSLDTYLNCPKHFWFRKIEKRPVKIKSDNLAIGTGIHGFLQFYANNPSASQKDCENAYRAAVDIPKLERKLSVRQYQPLVRKYMESGKILIPLDKTCTEKRFSLDCYGVPFMGFIDIIDDQKRICDYKTSSRPYSTYKVQESLQLSLYAAWFYAEYGELPYRVGYQVLLKDFSGIQEMWDTRTIKQLEDAKQLVAKCDAEVQTMESFEKRRGKLCSWCDYQGICR